MDINLLSRADTGMGTEMKILNKKKWVREEKMLNSSYIHPVCIPTWIGFEGFVLLLLGFL